MNLRFDQLRIATRLRLGFAVMVLMLVLVSGLGLRGMAANQQRMDEITKVNSIKSTLAVAMRDSVYERMVALRNMALVGSFSEMQPEAEKINLQQANYLRAEQQLVKLLAVSSSAASREKSVLAKIQAVDAAARPLIEKAAQLAMASQADQFYTVLVEELVPIQTEWMNALADLVLSQQRLSEQATSEARAAYESARLLMLIMGGAAILVAIAVSVILARSLLGQLGGELSYATSIAEKIAAGDLSIQVATGEQDRASLLAAMKTMRDSLAKIVGNVRRHSDTIAAAAGQIAADNVDLSARTADQANSMEETTALTIALTRAVAQNAEHAELANGIVSSAADAALTGGQAVAQLVHTMDSVNAAAKKIADIVGVIDSIAFQTNILALNAAVEAARAGEQGRGFAVVASEVRALAHRSANAAREIDSLIGDSVKKMAMGKQLVDQAGSTMDDVVAGVKRAAQLMGAITVASQSQRSDIAHVGNAVIHMEKLTRQNATLVGQTAASAASLHAHTAELAHSVSLFKTAAEAVAQPQSKSSLAVAGRQKQPAG